jgi:hypothetical protein
LCTVPWNPTGLATPLILHRHTFSKKKDYISVLHYTLSTLYYTLNHSYHLAQSCETELKRILPHCPPVHLHVVVAEAAHDALRMGRNSKAKP